MSRPAYVLAELIRTWDGKDKTELRSLLEELEWRCENHPHGWTVDDHLRGYQYPCQGEVNHD